MSKEKIVAAFESFLAERKDLTEDEKELLDFMKKMILRAISFMTIVQEGSLNPFLFKHQADMIFPEITFRFCHSVIIVTCGKRHAFNITLKDAETIPLESYVQKIRNLMATA